MLRLNVGGTEFVTTRNTLHQRGGMHFFSGLIRAHETFDETVFIDRDPTHFRHILNFLRGGLTCPSDPHHIEELIAEADYYALVELKAALQDCLHRHKRDNIAHMLSIIASKMG